MLPRRAAIWDKGTNSLASIKRNNARAITFTAREVTAMCTALATPIADLTAVLIVVWIATAAIAAAGHAIIPVPAMVGRIVIGTAVTHAATTIQDRTGACLQDPTTTRVMV